MKKILLLLVLLSIIFMYATDDYFTNNPRMRIINPTDGDALSWNDTYQAFDCGATIKTFATGVYVVDAGGGGDYTTIQSALDAINTLAVAEAAAGTYGDSKYILNIAPGTYTENLTIKNQKYLRINMSGVKIVGSVTFTTTQQTGDYYSKVEFVGGMSNRAEKGDNGEITGDILGTRNNDSLIYLSFTGMELSNSMSFTTDGTWVVFLNHTYFSDSSAFISGDFTDVDSCILLETMGKTRIKAHIAKASDGSATTVSLYDCSETEFDLINITPIFDGIIRNCTFKSDVTITAKTFEVDNFSYGEIMRQTEDLTGATITYMDNPVMQAETLATSATTFAVTSGIVTLTGDGAANTLATITGAGVGLYTILFVDAKITVTDTSGHAANTIDLLGSSDLTSADDTILLLYYDGTSFYEVSRSVN